ncbi:hypothetical protein ALMP_51900 [Streptomyces sp. A012304]|nr:hypothetical protein ALMP_51900 [Streptomyces sp. A012304]
MPPRYRICADDWPEPGRRSRLTGMAVAIVEALERDDFRIVDVLSGSRTERPTPEPA